MPLAILEPTLQPTERKPLSVAVAPALGRLGKVLAWAALLAGTAATLSLWFQSEHTMRELRSHALNQRLELVHQRISDRLATYAAMLHGARGLFAASERVSPGRWAAFTGALQLAD